MRVKNQHPLIPWTSSKTKTKLAVIGEAPGKDEDLQGEPFVGASGRLLFNTLKQLGVNRSDCFVGNVAQYRPPGNDINRFQWFGREIQDGLAHLREDLHEIKPNLCLLLGKTALRAFRPADFHGSQGLSIVDWRGSLFYPTAEEAPWSGKCMTSFHPAAIFRNWKWFKLFCFDMARASRQCQTPSWEPPLRSGLHTPTFEQAVETLEGYLRDKPHLAFDIEGIPDTVGITCVSFCPTPHTGIVIPFFRGNQPENSYWTEYEEMQMWKLTAAILSDASIPKSAQNGMYELSVYALRHGIAVRGLVDDTMFAHWELYPELEKNLGLQTSIYTEEPYYKSERTAPTFERQMLYNLKDSSVTREMIEIQRQLLSQQPRRLAHYEFNCRMAYPFAYMQVRGVKLDAARKSEHLKETTEKLSRSQAELNELVGHPINVKSPNQKRDLLYKELDLPVQHTGRGAARKVTTNEAALHKLHASVDPNSREGQIVDLLVTTIRLRTRISDINKLTTDADGRIRTSFNIIGTETGRLSSSQSVTGSGTNLQNVTKDLRDLFIPDSDEHWFWQLDLAGADAWTVACDCAALGDSTMLEDIRSGIKPSKVLLVMLAEIRAGRDPANVNRWDRDRLRNETQSVDTSSDVDASAGYGAKAYLCMKRVQHGTNYDAKPGTVVEVIFKDTDGKIRLTPRQADLYQRLYRTRYWGLRKRKEYVVNQLKQHRGIYSEATGVWREFLDIRGREPDANVIREALAHEPQLITTYCTNLALERVYYDPQNRTSRGGLVIVPALAVHDSLAGQFPKRITRQAADFVRSCFDNPIKIHGIEVTIPADGGYGPNWKATSSETGGYDL